MFGAGLTNRPFIKNMKPVVELNEKEGTTKMMDEKDKKIAELEAMVAELQKKLEGAPAAAPEMSDKEKNMEVEMADMKKKLEEYQANEKKALEDKKLSKKKASFDKLMLSGKAVEAQREAFMSDDMVKFSENAMTVQLSGKGSSEEPPASSASTKEEAEVEILKHANIALSEKKVKSLSDGIKLVLSEKADLKKLYLGN